MPLVQVEVVGESSLDGLATPLADAVGDALEARVGGTWVRLRALPAAQYGESGGVPDGVLPVFVHLVLSRHPEDLAERVRRVAEGVARVLDRPVQNVHVVVGAEGAGRVAFGGRLVE